MTTISTSPAHIEIDDGLDPRAKAWNDMVDHYDKTQYQFGNKTWTGKELIQMGTNPETGKDLRAFEPGDVHHNQLQIYYKFLNKGTDQEKRDAEFNSPAPTSDPKLNKAKDIKLNKASEPGKANLAPEPDKAKLKDDMFSGKIGQ